jgi:hypothetical protein
MENFWWCEMTSHGLTLYDQSDSASIVAEYCIDMTPHPIALKLAAILVYTRPE